MKRALVAGLVLTLAAGSALAWDAASDIQARKTGMKQIGGNLKGLSDTLNGDKNPAKLKEHAANIQRLSTQLPGWFPAGSGPSSGEKTKALATVWTDPVGFKAAADSFKAEATKLNAAAQSGDAAQVQAAFAATRGTCKGCHDKYQAK